MADAEKELGNTQFKAGNYEQAIVHFSKAIELGATHVLFSNRSACYCGLKKYDEALSDAEKGIEMNASWGKVRRARARATRARPFVTARGSPAGLILAGTLASPPTARPRSRRSGLRPQGCGAARHGQLRCGDRGVREGADDGARSEHADQGPRGREGGGIARPGRLGRARQHLRATRRAAEDCEQPADGGLPVRPVVHDEASDAAAGPVVDRAALVMGMLMGVNIQSPDSFAGGAPKEAAQPKKPPEPEPEPEPELTEEEKELKAKKATADAHKEKVRAGTPVTSPSRAVPIVSIALCRFCAVCTGMLPADCAASAPPVAPRRMVMHTPPRWPLLAGQHGLQGEAVRRGDRPLREGDRGGALPPTPPLRLLARHDSWQRSGGMVCTAAPPPPTPHAPRTPGPA
eukprot:5305071-Prymnesium_polylepis.2